MKTTKKLEVELSVDDLENMIAETIYQKFGMVANTHFLWKIVNKPRPGSDIHDSVDNHVFDGVKVTVTQE